MILALLAALASPAPDASPSAAAVYVKSLERMRETRQPEALQYRAHLSVPGGAIMAGRMSNGNLYIRFGQGDVGDSDGSFSLRVTRDTASYEVQMNGAVAKARMPMFNATWQGIDDWIRYGFDGSPQDPTPEPSISPSPSPENIKVIATVTSFGLAYYNARFGSYERCDDGQAGQVIDLSPIGDPYAHPLRSVTIDPTTKLFCIMHLVAPARPPFGYTAKANVTLHLADADGFLIVRKEEIDMIATAPRRRDVHAYATIGFSDFVIAP